MEVLASEASVTHAERDARTCQMCRALSGIFALSESLTAPSFFLIEGLLMYLSAADAADLMKQVRLLMTNLPPSSRL